ncbi:hypothetical protein TWF281_010410 [Arthrobotrys megalospora]
MASYLLECPVEIQLEVLDHLREHRNGLKRFSQASKLCRDRALPFLFAGVWLNPEAVAAFGDGGTLCSIRSCVRSGFSIPPSAVNNLYIALWKAISAFPNFKHIRFHPESPSRVPPREPYKYFYRRISPETREFLGPDEITNERIQDIVVPSPQYFETIDINAYDFELARHPGIFSKYFFFGCSGESLKFLKLCVRQVPKVTSSITDSPITIRFPNVAEIMFDCCLSYGHSYKEPLQWFAQSCPNVESFTMRAHMGFRIQLNTTDYEELAAMKKLRNLSIPWPRSATGRYRQQELSKFIRGLVDAGVTDLDNIEFFRLPPWNAYGNDYIFRECRIERGNEKAGAKLWWKRPYRYFEVAFEEKTRDQTELEDGDDSGDDLDERPPEGALVSTQWRPLG